MAFQRPITIERALSRIESHKYVLPGIQREFVWSTDQICQLFDSLMRGYPISSFLFWEVNADRSHEYAFYDFILDYHQKKAPHCPKLGPIHGRPVTAILDGQQRLTALNIGLRGSHAEKRPRLWWSSPGAFPKRELYLNLISHADEDDMEMEYEFRFLRESRASSADESEGHWFPVKKILGMEPGLGIVEYLQGVGLAGNRQAAKMLFRLHDVVHKEELINYFEEEDQDLNKVLSIFIRVNRAGTPLSYSDMLLSIATAQWRNLDARETIHSFVDDLNQTGYGFRFSKDLVLKAGLVLTDVNDIRFNVTNFNSENMTTLECKWDSVTQALQLAARLMARFGFSERTLRADSVLIPVAYYRARRELGESYLNSPNHQDDRESLRYWVMRALVKAGIWSGGLDTLLSRLRDAIRDHSNGAFPTKAMESAMIPLGKSLRFDEEEISDLAETQYSDRNVFPILSLLYPGVNVNGDYHVDHVFPRSRFSETKLRDVGVPSDLIDEVRQKMNGLPNLQLLEGSQNLHKSTMLPKKWAIEQFPDENACGMYLAGHDMHDLPSDMTEFLSFYEARRERIAMRLRNLLGVTPAMPR